MVLHNFFRRLSSIAVICMISACASNAVFPDEVIEDKTEIIVATAADGSTVKSERILASSDSLKTDTANIAYDLDDSNEVVLASKKEVVVIERDKTNDDDIKDVDEWLSQEVESEDVKTTTTKTTTTTTTVVQDQVTPQEELPQVFEPSVVYRLETIYFANGGASVDSKYNAKLREAANLAKTKDAQIKVLGYASSRTRNTDIVSHKMANFKISLQRAENVAAALRRAGVPASNITLEALSDSAPAYLEVMPEGERLNRRAEIYVSY